MTQMATIQAKNYVIDGFPRAIDQCQYFEQNICEVQMIIDYNISTDKMSKNLQDRCKDSERIDDSPDTIKKRINNYIDNTILMFEYYKTFGKVRTIYANLDIEQRSIKIKKHGAGNMEVMSLSVM